MAQNITPKKIQGVIAQKKWYSRNGEPLGEDTYYYAQLDNRAIQCHKYVDSYTNPMFARTLCTFTLLPPEEFKKEMRREGYDVRGADVYYYVSDSVTLLYFDDYYRSASASRAFAIVGDEVYVAPDVWGLLRYRELKPLAREIELFAKTVKAIQGE